jgi:hypothetical protein
MSNFTVTMQKKRDRTGENLKKNIKTLMKNSNKLRKYGADAYLVVHWKGQYWEFTSFVSPSRPPSTEELESQNLKIQIDSFLIVCRDSDTRDLSKKLPQIMTKSIEIRWI